MKDQVKPVVAQRGPFILDMEPGVYHWCACGRSKGQPFCDGSHKGTGIVPIEYTIKEKTKVAWCGCKHTGNGCLCDGTHNKIPA